MDEKHTHFGRGARHGFWSPRELASAGVMERGVQWLVNYQNQEVQKLKNEELEKIITDGKAKMPAYKSKLSEAEIDALVTFIRTFAPKKP